MKKFATLLSTLFLFMFCNSSFAFEPAQGQIIKQQTLGTGTVVRHVVTPSGVLLRQTITPSGKITQVRVSQAELRKMKIKNHHPHWIDGSRRVITH